jgi:hypothetical protein
VWLALDARITPVYGTRPAGAVFLGTGVQLPGTTINVELVVGQEVFEQHADRRASQQPPENEKTRRMRYTGPLPTVCRWKVCPPLKEAPIVKVGRTELPR